VDEHTAAVFDLRAQIVEVSGRGGLTVRRRGVSTVLPAGTVIALARLRDLVSRGQPPTGTGAPVRPDAPGTGAPVRPDAPGPGTPACSGQSGDAVLPLPDLIAAAEQRFDRAERDCDAAAMVAAIIDLEAAIHAWAADTEEDQGTERARAVLRGLVTRLGQAAQDGLADPRAAQAGGRLARRAAGQAAPPGQPVRLTPSVAPYLDR
jgi:hypothetical protein